MPPHIRRRALRRWPLTLASVIVAAWAASAQASSAKPPVSFDKDIAPIFRESCAPCHTTAEMGRLKLDSEAAVLRGGQSGPAIVAGHGADSLLVKRLLGVGDAPRMPMGRNPLSAAQIALIRSWIDRGSFSAPAPQIAHSAPRTTGSSPIFAQNVRPILAARCYSCHGSDLQQNGLRLDSLPAILKGSDYGPVVVPGHSDKSRLVRRLLAQERPQMPYGGPPLSSEQVATIRHWIDIGAPGPDDSTPAAASKPLKHWAYLPPVRPALPAVKDTAWCRNPIDRFILARLEKENLHASPQADPATLLRRVYLDLIGLPPSPAELENFVADPSDAAYEKVVDKLFASPRYGEHWARQWLDLARYADSNGYEKDRIRTAWEYRDWVIRALNANLSFRDFTIDQIAGDMLPNPTDDQLIATGFNRNSMLNQEGGIDVDEYYYYTQVDRVNTTASVWLGSTLGCAQCHNHKFDPFPQKDYYRFLAFFNNSEHHITDEGDRWMDEPELELPTPEQAKQAKQIRSKIAQLEDVLRTQTPELDSAQARWESQLHAAEQQWTVLHPSEIKSLGGAILKPLNDGSILAGGINPQADTYVLKANVPFANVTGVRLEVIPDRTLPHGGPGRDPAGNFFLSDFDVQLPAASAPVKWNKIVDNESQSGYAARNLSNKEPGQLVGWAIKETDSAPVIRTAVFTPEKPFDSSSSILITLKHGLRHASRNIGRFRISVTASANPAFVAEVPASLRPIVDIPVSQRTPEQKEKLSAAFRAVAPELDSTRKQIESLNKDLKNLHIATAMVMREKPDYARPSAYIRERGTFTSPGELVYADVPSSLPPLPKTAMPNRLGLAEWLVSDNNPLTARVTVNHFWEAIFGHGIVETAEDFGTQGDPPSHPQLLDWLATEFMQSGWDMKKIQRLMVMSAAYRQSSAVTPDLEARDPYNKLYARGPRFRVDAETVHDIALSASGLLSDKMFGPPVFPYQPGGVWNIPYSSDKWVESNGEDRYRRAIYTFIRRSAPYPSLTTYDAPSREFCTIRRVRTNTPLQALTSLNDPYFFDAARAMAQRMMSSANTIPERIGYGFELVVSRKPTAAELSAVAAFYKQQLETDSKHKALSLKPVSIHDDAGQNPPELAAWTMVANVLLNMDEAITKN